eukprot:SAG11_NODE_25358_length_359_cov_43.888462_2_plen_35_part_01
MTQLGLLALLNDLIIDLFFFSPNLRFVEVVMLSVV